MVKSEQIYSPQNFILAVTGDCLIIDSDNDVEFIEEVLKEKGYELWSYAFTEIERIVQEKLNVVLVECMVYDEGTGEFVNVYRWFEVPEDFEEDELCDAD